MRLQTLRISNFQSFGSEPTEIEFEEATYLIGHNGSGKTAVLQALCRLFSFEPSLRRILRSDFHVPFNEKEPPTERELWIEAEFEFPELGREGENSRVPPFFRHMRLETTDGTPTMRFRLIATMGENGDIEEQFVNVIGTNPDGGLNAVQVARADRNLIHVHYLPAQRDPAKHIAYGANALLGRMLRAITWSGERETIYQLSSQINENLKANNSIIALGENLQTTWDSLYSGSFFSDPRLTFTASDIESLLRYISVSFTPGHDESLVDFSRLSDGQKSMFYLSLVLTSLSIGREALKDESLFNIQKLRPPVFTIIAVEEPENSLSPHYLGRIANVVSDIIGNEDAQALIATHAPSMLKRIEPKKIRHLRLNSKRLSTVESICLPNEGNEEYKFVREAVQAYPELYFSRLVILCEGDSEEIVLSRLFKAKDVSIDEYAISIVPLGGRHVNHFWRLLSVLKIPYLTLLDLDLGRYYGGWGRIKYVNDQLVKYKQESALPESTQIPSWNNETTNIRKSQEIIQFLESKNVFFSSPMDLDYSMLLAYPEAYEVEPEDADDALIKAVLGKSYHNLEHYSAYELQLFRTYHRKFKLQSKPGTHIEGLAKLSDDCLVESLPESLENMVTAAIQILRTLPE